MKKRRVCLRKAINSLLPDDFDDITDDEARYIEAARKRGYIETEESDRGEANDQET